MTTKTKLIEQRLFPSLRKKQLEILYVPPQRIGPLTPMYHRIVPLVKVAPWKVIVIWAIALSLFLRFILGSSFVHLATLLQRAF